MATRTFTLAALSWLSPQSLARCLASWQPLARSEGCVQRLVHFQERAPSDTRLASEHGYVAIGDETNIGIGPAYRALLDRAEGDHLIFLECDWRLVHPRRAATHVQHAMELISRGEADLVRLRSRRRPGWPVNPAQLQNRELDHPYWLLDSAFWEPRPQDLFPDQLSGLASCGEQWVVADARHAGWTNNPHIATTEWLREQVRPWTFGAGTAFEGLIDEHWVALPARIAQGHGLFTHDRIDGPGYAGRPLHHRIGYPLRMRARRHLRRFAG